MKQRPALLVCNPIGRSADIYTVTGTHLARQKSCLWPTLRLSPASDMGAARPPASLMAGFS
jgi:hypothetical protein